MMPSNTVAITLVDLKDCSKKKKTSLKKVAKSGQDKKRVENSCQNKLNQNCVPQCNYTNLWRTGMSALCVT